MLFCCFISIAFAFGGKTFTNLQQALLQPDSVEKIVLRRQKLHAFPEELKKFKYLKTIDLGRNYISTIPAWVADFAYLEVVVLDNNSLEEIPSTLCTIITLKQLDVWNNNISVFSPEMVNLKKLQVLDLRAILIDQDQQNAIAAMLPQTKIYFSPACRCKTQ